MPHAHDQRPSDGAAPAWHRLEARTVVTSLAVALVAVVAALALATEALLDDGPQLVEELARPGGLPLWFHVLYLPVAKLLVGLGATPERALLLVSALAAGVLVGSAHASAFVVTGRRGVALATSLAVALCPGVVRHATFVEVHALHAAAVAVVVLAIVAAHGRARLVLGLLVAGAATTVLTHRSAALVAPALALVATAALQQGGVPNAFRRAGAATGLGLLLGYAADELLHRAFGGPPLLESLFQVRNAANAPSLGLTFHELIVPLGALWLGAIGDGRTALRFAPLLALLGHGVPVVLAAIPTQGGYCLGAVPLLALGLAQQGARHGTWWWRTLFASALALSAFGAFAALTDPVRTEFAAMRRQRLELVRRCLPDGGTVFGFEPRRQHVTGALPGVNEVDAFFWSTQMAIVGMSSEASAERLRELLDAALQRGAVLWTAEWRHPDLPPSALQLLDELERRVLDGRQRDEVPGTAGRAWWVRR